VTAAIQEASLRGQIAATQRIIAIERNLRDILKRQFSFGQAAQADVLAQEARSRRSRTIASAAGKAN